MLKLFSDEKRPEEERLRKDLLCRLPATCKILLVSIVISIGLVALIIYGPYISTFLAFGPIGFTDWMFIIGSAVVYLAIFESLKLYKRVKSKS